MLLPFLTVLLTMVSVTLGAALAKSLFPALGPEGVTALRLLFATMLLLLVLRPWRRIEWLRQPGALRWLLLYGIALGAMNLLFYRSLRGIPLGVAVAIEFLGPLTVALIASRSVRDFVWIAFAVAGLAALLPWPGSNVKLETGSLIAAFGAAACWALYIVFGQRLGRHAGSHGAGGVAIAMIVATAVAFPAGAITSGTALLEPKWWPTACLVAVFSSAIPYPLEMYALQRMPSRTFGTLLSLEPAFAALSGLFVLGEWLTPTQALGIGSIIVAMAGAVMTARGRTVSNGA